MRERNSEDSNRQCESQEFPKWVGDEKEGDRYDGWRRVAEVEKHVEGATTIHCGKSKYIKEDEITNVLVMQSNKPTNHIRIVIAGISGSSTLDTEARTSGYGLSSSSMASKSKSNLEEVGIVSNLVRKAGLKTERKDKS